MCYGYRTVRTEWEARRAQCGVSGREHVRGRIAVPEGDASGLFSQYAQFAWWIDRCGPRPRAAGLRILCAQHGHTAIHVSRFGFDRDCRRGRFGARPCPAGFYGGIALVLLPTFALIASAELPGQRGFAFGPGTAPRLFSFVLAALGAAVAIGGVFAEGPPIEKYKIR